MYGLPYIHLLITLNYNELTVNKLSGNNFKQATALIKTLY